MVLPGGTAGNQQVMTGINTTDKIYLLMSENVSIASTGGVTLKTCGSYLGTFTANGPLIAGIAAHAPLTNPSCSGSGTAVTTTLTLLDNSFGSSVVEVTP